MTAFWFALGIGPPLVAVGSLFVVNVLLPYARRLNRKRRSRLS